MRQVNEIRRYERQSVLRSRICEPVQHILANMYRNLPEVARLFQRAAPLARDLHFVGGSLVQVLPLARLRPDTSDHGGQRSGGDASISGN